METQDKRRNKVKIMPKTDRILRTVGEQIKLARKRRKIAAGLVAQRAGISRSTLWKVEKGDAGVAMGIYAKVLAAIGLQEDLLLLAKDDKLGRFLQDQELLDQYKRGKEEA